MMEQSQRRKRIVRFSLPSIMISLTVIYCILFPADKINIKEIILLATLFVCSPAIIGALKQKNNVMLVFYGLIYPCVTTVFSIIIGDSSINGALSFGYVWVFLLLVPAIVSYDVDIKKPFIFATTLVAIVIDFIYLSDVLGIISIFSNPLVLFLSSMKELQYGKGIVATFGYSIFYKACPLILFTYAYTLYNKKYAHAAILFLSLIASGTRANFYVALLVTATIPILCSRKPFKKVIALVAVIGVSLYILPSAIDRMVALNAIKENSDSIKIDTITSIFDHMNNAPFRYIFGSGVGSYFYSTGRNAYVNVVEVSYFDYFRQVGIVGFLFFTYFLIRPVRWCLKNERWLLIVYIGYLALAFTNPLLVTSTSFMAYILIYSCGMSQERQSLLQSKVALRTKEGG